MKTVYLNSINHYFLKNNESRYNPFHEELSQKKVMANKNSVFGTQRKSDFLTISNSTPFYAGWDQGLRKLIITNRLLPRSYECYGLYSPTLIKNVEFRTLADFTDSNKKVEFTTWPLSKTTLEKTPKSLSTIPYNVLFESVKDPKTKGELVESLLSFDDMELYPANLGQYIETPTEKVFPPNKGGFVWRGNESLKFDLINSLKKAN